MTRYRKYSALESLFSNRWKWVRRLSKALWVKDKVEGFMWVKFTNNELKEFERIGFTFSDDERYLVEDYR